MILYHRTQAAIAEQIFRDGFHDGTGTYMTTHEHTGVWLSNVPLDVNEGARGDTLLQVELPVETINDYEWIEEGKPYREWLVPARLINQIGRGSALSTRTNRDGSCGLKKEVLAEDDDPPPG